jgi:F-type H+-transporting ATPase subunit alpha
MPYRLSDEVALMIAVQSGLLDSLPPAAIAAFRAALPQFLDKQAPDTIAAINAAGRLDPAMRALLMDALLRLATRVAQPGANHTDTDSS